MGSKKAPALFIHMKLNFIVSIFCTKNENIHFSVLIIFLFSIILPLLYYFSSFPFLLKFWQEKPRNSFCCKSDKLVMHSWSVHSTIIFSYWCPIPMKSSIYELSILWHVSIYLSRGRSNTERPRLLEPFQDLDFRSVI